MSKLKLSLILGGIACLLLLNNCKKDDDLKANSAITNLSVSDNGDAGNGTDLRISFTKLSNQSMISDYRIFVISSAESANFDLEAAENVNENNSFSVAKTGGNITTNLAADSKTTAGELIGNDVPYRIFVMSVSLDANEFKSALSDPSEEITLTDSQIGFPVPKVGNLQVEDISNEGNGADLQVSFSKIGDESRIDGYRIFVVNSAESASFDIAAAEALSANSYTEILRNGENVVTNLAADATTISGELIGNDAAYVIFVMTVSSNPSLYLNALSSPSDEILLDNEDRVEVTFIANDGVMIEFQGKKVIIDGMNRTSNLGGWITPSQSLYNAVENGEPPFDNIDVIMITHNHGDHYSTQAVQNYLNNFPQTQLIVPTSIEGNFTAFSDRIVDFSLPKYDKISILENGISIDVLHIEHFDQFGNIFNTVESFAYQINFDDKKFIHFGDIDYVDSTLEVFDLLDENITVAFIPTFGNLVNAINRDEILNKVNPDNIVCLHFLSGSLSTTLSQIETFYPDADTFTMPFETRKY